MFIGIYQLINLVFIQLKNLVTNIVSNYLLINLVIHHHFVIYWY